MLIKGLLVTNTTWLFSALAANTDVLLSVTHPRTLLRVILLLLRVILLLLNHSILLLGIFVVLYWNRGFSWLSRSTLIVIDSGVVSRDIGIRRQKDTSTGCWWTRITASNMIRARRIVPLIGFLAVNFEFRTRHKKEKKWRNRQWIVMYYSPFQLLLVFCKRTIWLTLSFSFMNLAIALSQ